MSEHPINDVKNDAKIGRAAKDQHAHHSPLSAAPELGPRHDPAKHHGMIRTLFDHPVGLALLIAAFGLALSVLFLD